MWRHDKTPDNAKSTAKCCILPAKGPLAASLSPSLPAQPDRTFNLSQPTCYAGHKPTKNIASRPAPFSPVSSSSWRHTAIQRPKNNDGLCVSQKHCSAPQSDQKYAMGCLTSIPCYCHQILKTTIMKATVHAMLCTQARQTAQSLKQW